jgi:hypothetical protein
MRFRTTYLFLLMTVVAVFSAVAVVFKISGNVALIAFGIWAVVFSFFVMGETTRD